MAHRKLLFVDTNILLDFYRMQQGSKLSLLRRLDGLHDHIITSYQVEMEFKKNRQQVLLKTLANLELPKPFSVPAFLAEARVTGAIAKKLGAVRKQVDDMRSKLRRVLANPTLYDPVYKVVQRLFKADTPMNLTRANDARFTVRRLALKRFALGYPPRKAGDTSIGDALNWEWLIHCAKNCSTPADIIIVSRDTDYGATIKDESYLSDWLLHEFRERVSRRRTVHLVNKLAVALKMANLKVSKEEEQEEANIVEMAKSPGSDISLAAELLGRRLHLMERGPERSEALQRFMFSWIGVEDTPSRAPSDQLPVEGTQEPRKQK
jgi:hypothetical protein